MESRFIQGFGNMFLGRGGCANLDPGKQAQSSETCPSPDTAVSQPEEALAAEYEPLGLVSGAGHDALAIAKLTKVCRSLCTTYHGASATAERLECIWPTQVHMTNSHLPNETALERRT